jgi:hypothetical protein
MEGPPFEPSEQQLENLEKVSSGMRTSSSQNTKVTKYHFLKAKNYDQNNKIKLLIKKKVIAESRLSILLNPFKVSYPFKVSFLKNPLKKDTLELTFDNKELIYKGNNERIKNALIVTFNSILGLFNSNKPIIDEKLLTSKKLLSESDKLLELENLLSKSESENLLSKSEGLLLESDKLLLDNLKFLNDLTQTLKEIEIEIEKEQKGGKPAKYKSTGITVFILYKNKKYNRTIYVKDKGKTKYCKINNEYILLSKLKVI